jgi:transposase
MRPLKVTCDISLSDLDERLRYETGGKVVRRLQAMRMLVKNHTVPEVGEELGVSGSTLRRWLHRFNLEGPEGLRDRPRPGQPPKLVLELVEDFKGRVRTGALPGDGVCTLRGTSFQRILKEEYGADYSLGGTYFLLHRLGFSSLVPRPQHPQADGAAQEDWEKTFCRKR